MIAISDRRDTLVRYLDVIWIADCVSASTKITVEISPLAFFEMVLRKREPGRRRLQPDTSITCNVVTVAACVRVDHVCV